MTLNMTKCENKQNIVVHSIMKLKYTVGACPIRYLTTTER